MGRAEYLLMNPPPQIILIAGPNGAGKSTTAPVLVPPGTEFINADDIATNLRANATESRNPDVLAGRLLLQRMDELEAQHANIAVETTLASRSLAPRIARLREKGYLFSLFYIWLPAPELCIARVASRVRRGGHSIPEDVIRRRYQSVLRNFFQLYLSLADSWEMVQNLKPGEPVRIAAGVENATVEVTGAALWDLLQKEYASG